jgi:hypothetical protein
MAPSVYLCFNNGDGLADVAYMGAIVIESPRTPLPQQLLLLIRLPSLSVYICTQETSHDAPLQVSRSARLFFVYELPASNARSEKEEVATCYKRSRKPMSGPTLTRFFQESNPDNLRKVTLKNLTLNEYRCRVLASNCATADSGRHSN